MSNFQSNVYLAKPIEEVRSLVLDGWGGVDSGARGDSRHCPRPSSHNAAAGGCKQETPIDGKSYHPNYIHAWDWGHHYAKGYRDVAKKLLHGPGQKYIRYIIMDSKIHYPDHRGGGTSPSSGHTWHMHISFMPGTHDLSGVDWFGSGSGSSSTFKGLNIGGLKVADLTKNELGWMILAGSNATVKRVTELIRDQDNRTKAMLGIVLNAVEGDADREAFEKALAEDREKRAEMDELLRATLRQEVVDVIGNMDAIDGAPADDVAQAVVDLFTTRLEE